MSRLHSSIDIDSIGFGHAWRSVHGNFAAVSLGLSTMTFDGAEMARDVAAACLAAAEALDALAADDTIKLITQWNGAPQVERYSPGELVEVPS